MIILWLTESTAKKYFGSEEAMGKIIAADDKINFKVTAIIEDFPKNSTFNADMLFPMSLLEKNMYAGNTEGKNLENDFVQFNYNTFLLMKPGLSLSGFTDKLKKIHLRIKPDDTDADYLLLPLKKMHLHRADGSDGGFNSDRNVFYHRRTYSRYRLYQLCQSLYCPFYVAGKC